MSTRRTLGTAALALLMTAPQFCLAQTSDSKGCASQEQLQPGERGPQARTEGSGNLSDRLSRSGGVLCPPNVDPDMKTPPPQNGGRMPVIPPPGSPGGDPSVKPK